MLKKIMKHDFIFIGKIYVPIFIGVLCVTFLSILLHLCDQVLKARDITYLDLTVQTVDAFMFFLLICVPALTAIVISAVFYKTVAGNEGYLTHTLPVTKRDIVIGKNLVGLCFYAVSMLISLLCAFLFLWATQPENLEVYHGIREIVAFFHTQAFLEQSPQILSAAVLFLLALLMQEYATVSYGFLCVSLGQMMNRHKIIYTILFGVLLSFSLSTASSFLLSILSITMLGFDLSDIVIRYLAGHYFLTLHLFALIALMVNLVFAAICNFISVWLLQKKLNLE